MKLREAVAVTVISACSLMSGCASIVSGTTENIAVDTPNVKGARCDLSNDKGSWWIGSTPGEVKVKRSGVPLKVACKKGLLRGGKEEKAGLNGMVFGNILVGGVVGVVVDAVDGAANSYNDKIEVPMRKS